MPDRRLTPNVLYPPRTPDPQHPHAGAAAALAGRARSLLRLVLLDDTWRKAAGCCGAILLQALPTGARAACLALRHPQAHAPHQRSTLEAAQQALLRLEPSNPDIAALENRHGTFIAQQRVHSPPYRLILDPPDP